MFDFSHFSQNAVVSEYILKPAGTATQRPSHAWHKPPNVRLVFMMAIGGGAGGAGGTAGLVGTSRSGGGGGGSGAITQALFLASSLPSTLYIFQATFATAGQGGASFSNGTAGSGVYISNYASNTVVPLAAYIYSVGGTGGTTGGAGGGGAATFSLDAALLNHSIYWSSTSGRAGTFGGAGFAGTTSIGTASPILGGAGGGGVLAGTPTVSNGAGFTSEIPAILPDIAGGLASSALDASSGVRLPFVSVGGAGGGGNDNGPGGRGGNGIGYGAGGGGGGAGVIGQGGRGGDGGPAYACIIAW